MQDAEKIRQNFSKRLNELLDERDYLPRGRAQRLVRELKLDITDRAVNKWLKGESMPDVGNMRIIANFFGVSFDWLATGGELSASAGAQALQNAVKPTLDLIEKNKTLQTLKEQIEAMQTGGVLTTEQALSIVDTVAVAMPANDVPLISWVAAGSWSEVNPVTLADAEGYYPRPRNLSADGFALRVRGRSMLPKFEPDDIIYVEPNVSTLALKDGDLIVVQCNDDTEATFKQLVLGETESDMYLKPLNPDWPEQKMVPMGECRLVGKVVGKLVEY